MPNPILGGGGFHHIAWKVRDFDKSLHLYTQTFGFRPKIAWGEVKNGQDSRAAMLDVGDGNYIEIFAGGPATHLPDGVLLHVAFRTTRIDAVIARAKAAGLTVTMEPKSLDIPSTPPTPVRIAFVQGYDGELLEFFQNAAT